MRTAKQRVGKNIARLAARPGFSKSGLAAYLGVKAPMVSRWLKGGNLPLIYLDRITEYFQVDISELFTAGEQEPPPPPRQISREEAWRILLEPEGLTITKKRNKTKNG